MFRSAGVHSIAALRHFREALCNFGAEATSALDAIMVEIHRTQDWLEHDQLKYWQVEIRRRQEAVVNAKAELDRARIAATFGRSPDCTDQKKALLRARQRLEEAEEKLAATKRWGRIVETEVSDFQGPAQQFSNLLAGNLPQALAELDRLSAALEAYLSLPPAAARGERDVGQAFQPDAAAEHAGANPPAGAPGTAGSDGETLGLESPTYE